MAGPRRGDVQSGAQPARSAAAATRSGNPGRRWQGRGWARGCGGAGSISRTSRRLIRTGRQLLARTGHLDPVAGGISRPCVISAGSARRWTTASPTDRKPPMSRPRIQARCRQCRRGPARAGGRLAGGAGRARAPARWPGPSSSAANRGDRLRCRATVRARHRWSCCPDAQEARPPPSLWMGPLGGPTPWPSRAEP